MKEERHYLESAAGLMADFVGSETCATWFPETEGLDQDQQADQPLLVTDNSRLPEGAREWAQVLVPLRLSRGDLCYTVLGRRRGGRRYLSGDLNALGRLAAAVVEQMERFRANQMQRLVSRAELRALQAQINPHFLFNALNAVYGTIPREARDARRIVLNLADVFRYFLRPGKTFVPLSEELQIVRAYLEIESLRLGARLQTEIDADEATLAATIPALSIQPLVENAVKHGIARQSGPGTVQVRIRESAPGIHVEVSDTGEGFGEGGETAGGEGFGVGLENVRQRLKLCYGPEVELHVHSGPGGTTVGFDVPCAQPSIPRADRGAAG
jgi:LytS/YehU family sensor histidine kinase